ncbi:MAG TPA: carboxylating nicotinate-nucleotide diphosphorylase [Nitrosopumilaceae archaeon]|nr:carboxylating nicotinate-nucleotide diphosphorylase [Nitrosopumilaceae archaeon]
MDKRPKKDLAKFLSEDIGRGDITSNLLPRKKIKTRIISRQDGIIAGVNYVKEIFRSKGCKVKIIKKDGDRIKPNQTILEITGYAKMILSCERTALNLLSRMSGIATKTKKIVDKINAVNSRVKLYSTRKTAPGLRFFDKEAVKIGGGEKHRMSLDEMIMIKDNHLAVAGSIPRLIFKARKKHKKIEIEVENQEDALLAASGGANIIMLDNFSPKEIINTIKRLKKSKLRNQVKLEASGGINEKNVSMYAKTGVDMISMGEITNSVAGIDFSLEIP